MRAEGQHSRHMWRAPGSPLCSSPRQKCSGAQDIAAGRQGCLTGTPGESPKYLILFCNYGQVPISPFILSCI